MSFIDSYVEEGPISWTIVDRGRGGDGGTERLLSFIFFFFLFLNLFSFCGDGVKPGDGEAR